MLDNVLHLLEGWKPVFAQERTAERAIEQTIASVCVVGRRPIARSIAVREGEGGSFTADYKLFSRAPWDAHKLFVPMLEDALAFCDTDFVAVGGDDTRVRKTGKKIRSAHWGRDPLSPHFHVNLQWGLRFLHGALLVPLHARSEVAARALPVWFEEVPPAPKPGKKATDLERAAYRAAKRERRLSQAAVAMLKRLRAEFDEAGAANKQLVGVFDGSYCNKVVFRAELERTHVVARARKDASLCFPFKGEGRRVYDTATFTPEDVLKDTKRKWIKVSVFHGGEWREVRYKQVSGVLWRGGCGRRPLRLLVVAPTPYRKTKTGRLMYRQPAYLLTTDPKRSSQQLLQAYFDRWQVEVAHREMKDTFGVGEAQVRSLLSVPRQPALSAATYSALHLAALEAYGARRPECLGPLPKWQREKTRPSCLDLIRQVRKEVVERAGLGPDYDLQITADSILAAAAT
jgi:hypothetical protein